MPETPFPAPDGFRCVASETVRRGDETPARIVHPDPGLRVTLAPTAPVPAGWYRFELIFPPEGLCDAVIQFTFVGGAVLWLRMPLTARNHFLAHFRLEKALTLMT